MSDAEKKLSLKSIAFRPAAAAATHDARDLCHPDKETIPVFLKASRNRDMETIRALVRSDKT